MCIRSDKFTEFCDKCKQEQNQLHTRNSSNKKKAESLWRKRENENLKIELKKIVLEKDLLDADNEIIKTKIAHKYRNWTKKQ